MKDADKNISAFEILEEDDHPVHRYESTSRARVNQPTSRASNSSGWSTEIDSGFLETCAAFTVLRVLFFDILVSFGDAVTDFLQGFNLIFPDWFSTRVQPEPGDTTWKYGVATLVICWIPGLVGVIHMVTHYRLEFNKTKYFRLRLY